MAKQQIGAANARAFQAWASDRAEAGDWASFVHNGKLNRTKIAETLGFGRSAFQQNPAIKQAAAKLEAQFALNRPLAAAEGHSEDLGRVLSREEIQVLQNTIQRLETRIATLSAENAGFRLELKRLKALQNELVPDGRRIHTGFLGMKNGGPV